MTTHSSSTTGQDDSLQNPYADEARKRWGHTDAYRQSQERVGKMSKDDLARIQADNDSLLRELAALTDRDPASPAVQAIIARHYAGLRHFYEPTLPMYRGLAQMYVDDPRFTAFYEKYKPGLAAFLRDGMLAYCDAQETV
jgi:hypothetical protein